MDNYEENRQKAPYFSGGMNAVHRQPYYASRQYNTIMRKTYRYRLYPSKSQVTLLEQTLEICR
ncbi:MAG: helix-turn-helix domain-containing protein, partial [Candidatus Methanoculleus thermohydrogenotrophicum]